MNKAEILKLLKDERDLYHSKFSAKPNEIDMAISNVLSCIVSEVEQ